jgi:hypothetical protein
VCRIHHRNVAQQPAVDDFGAVEKLRFQLAALAAEIGVHALLQLPAALVGDPQWLGMVGKRVVDQRRTGCFHRRPREALAGHLHEGVHLTTPSLGR